MNYFHTLQIKKKRTIRYSDRMSLTTHTGHKIYSILHNILTMKNYTIEGRRHYYYYLSLGLTDQCRRYHLAWFAIFFFASSLDNADGDLIESGSACAPYYNSRYRYINCGPSEGIAYFETYRKI